ncbi:MAG TPA: carboxymuconolactone decarboxylase family protein [Polyangia bacterium]|jgi:4-carboxymuconolactone decarboxylase
MPTSTFEIGLALANKLHGQHAGDQMIAALQKICPDYIKMNMEWAYAGITARPDLPIETRVLIVLACCVCRDYPVQVRAYAEAALGLGVTREAVVETVLQTLPIAGFPAVTNALLALDATVAARATPAPPGSPGDGRS